MRTSPVAIALCLLTSAALSSGCRQDMHDAPRYDPLEESAFDLSIVDNTSGLLSTLRAEDRVALVRELLRVLRPGGRVMVIGTAARGGLGALLTRAASGPAFDPVPSLEAEGFRSARALAEREGLTFTEALKPR